MTSIFSRPAAIQIDNAMSGSVEINKLPIENLSKRPVVNVTNKAVKAALDAIQTRSSADLKMYSNAIVFSKDTPEISVDELVRLGQTSGASEGEKDKIKLRISQKIDALKESAAKNFCNLCSARDNLCKLSKISHIHYYDLKEKVLDSLTELLESDLVLPATSVGILDIIIQLSEDLASSTAQKFSLPLQKTLARACSVAVVLFLRHYNKEHLSAITATQKKDLLKIQRGFGDLNKQENGDIEFAKEMALEACKRLTDDKSMLSAILERLPSFVEAVANASKGDLAKCVSGLEKTFEEWRDKIPGTWFDMLFLLRETVLSAPNDSIKITAIQAFLESFKNENWPLVYGVGNAWKFVYGALEILEKVILKMDDKDSENLKLALFGQSEKCSKPSASQNEDINFPGLIHFLEFDGYVKKARVIRERDKKADEVIRKKANQVGELLISRLYATSNGQKIILQSNHSGNKALMKIVDAFSSSQKETHTIDVEVDDFHRSITKGDLLKFYNLLNRKTKLVESLDSNGNSPLILAARAGHLEICKLLIKAGCSPITTGENDRNALHVAASAGYDEIVILFKADALLNEEDKDGKTALMLAAENGHASTCKVLLANGAKHNVMKHGQHALHHAVKSKNIRTVQELVKCKDLVNDHGKISPLIMAAESGSAEICKVLLTAGADPGALTSKHPKRNAMQVAAVAAKDKVIELLFLKDRELIKVPDLVGRTPLMLAASSKGNSLSASKALISSNADLRAVWKEVGWNAMHAAAETGNTDVVKLLAVDTFLINSRTYEGVTPLMLAASKGHVATCEALLNAGADPFAVDKDNCNVLHCATEFGKIEIAVMLNHRLKEQFIKLSDMKNLKGLTPIHLSARRFSCAVGFADTSPEQREHFISMQQKHFEMCRFLFNPKLDYSNFMELASNFENKNFKKDNPVPSKFNNDLERKASMSVAAGIFLHKQIRRAKDQLNNKIDLAKRAKVWEIFVAIREGKTKVVVELLAKDKSLINLKTPGHRTLLQEAIYSGHLEICDILLKEKSDTNFLHFAVENCTVEIFSNVLGHYKSKVNLKDQNDRTPLMYAAELGYLQKCTVLLHAGASLFEVDNNGDNALHYAARAGNVEITKLLLSYNKFIILSVNKKREMPLMQAVRHERREVFKYLLQEGADPFFTNEEGQNVFHIADGINWKT